jgi:zinc D-Ala-D-Ala carboxypeptidase
MLQRLPDDWRRFAEGKAWRCRAPDFLCEVGEAGQVPSLLSSPGIADRVRRIRSFYAGRVSGGVLDRSGTALDILVANAMTESYGTVPSPLDRAGLERLLDAQDTLPLDTRLDTLLRGMERDKPSKWLVRREPGYTTPVATPARVSVGAHHMLLSTAMALPSQRQAGQSPAQATREQVLRLASDSLYAARAAVEYLNSHQGRHDGELPLIAATYNAGSPRRTDANPWHLVQYGEHIDRWISYYNASRQAQQSTLSPRPGTAPPLPLPVTRRTDLPAGSPVAPAVIGAGASGLDSRLSPHFSLAKLTASTKASELHINNQPGPAATANLRRLANRLEQVQALLGADLHINSAYRCEALNKAVGSKGTSMHLLGLAADFVCPAYGSPLKIARAIAASGLGFDQVIHEFGRWVHLGLSPEGSHERRQQLTIDRAGTHVGLLPAQA